MLLLLLAAALGLGWLIGKLDSYSGSEAVVDSGSNSKATRGVIDSEPRSSVFRRQRTSAGSRSQDNADEISSILAEKDGQKRRAMIGDLAREWVKSDWESCLDWAQTLSPSDQSSALVPTVEGMLNEGGEMAAYAIYVLDSLEGGETRDDVLMMNFPKLFEMDEGWALAQVTSFSNSYAINVAADALVRSDGNIAESLESMKENLPLGEFRERYILSAVGRIASSDPRLAIRWLEENQDFDSVGQAYTRVGVAIAALDPEVGLSMAASIKGDMSRDGFMRGIIQKWSAENPQEVTSWLMAGVSEGRFDEVDKSVKYVMPSWLGWEGEKVFRRIEGLTDEDARRALMGEALEQAAAINPVLAAQEIYRDGGNPELANPIDYVERIVEGWMGRDPIAASKWVTTIPEVAAKDRAVSIIVDEVLRRDGDIEMARMWLKEISDPELASRISMKVDQFGE